MADCTQAGESWVGVGAVLVGPGRSTCPHTATEREIDSYNRKCVIEK